MAAALSPGAAVFASGATDWPTCSWAPPDAQTVAQYPLVVIASVQTREDRTATLASEAYLKGSGPAQLRLTLSDGQTPGLCDRAPLAAGQRVLLLLELESGSPHWPSVDGAYYLEGDSARSANPTAGTPLRADDLVDLITGETDQVVVPAQFDDESEGIEWTTTVLPIAVALGIVFVIGLFLMRIWHRIDPT